MIVIGIGGVNVCKEPETIVTYALGSCVGVCLYDATAKVAGMAHVMLPSSSILTNEKPTAKYADIAIPELIRMMELQGAKKNRLTAKIAGGANMFNFAISASTPNIGEKNIIAVKDLLKKHQIIIRADDTGLNYGRTITFNPANGDLLVKKPTGELYHI